MPNFLHTQSILNPNEEKSVSYSHVFRKNKKSKAGKMALWVKVLASQACKLKSKLEPTQENQRHRASNLLMFSVACQTSPIIIINFLRFFFGSCHLTQLCTSQFQYPFAPRRSGLGSLYLLSILFQTFHHAAQGWDGLWPRYIKYAKS